jgi:hypothetical protein
MSTSDGPSKPTEPSSLPAPRKPISDVLSRGTDAVPPLPVDESAAALELRLQRELDGRRQDKFYGIAIGTVLIDMAVFQHLSWIGIVCIFLLELVILTGLARQFGNEHITILLDYLFHKLLERIGLGSGGKD